jgi:hypothetical protein
VIEDATAGAAVTVYALAIAERNGVKHTGLPPGFD